MDDKRAGALTGHVNLTYGGDRHPAVPPVGFFSHVLQIFAIVILQMEPTEAGAGIKSNRPDDLTG